MSDVEKHPDGALAALFTAHPAAVGESYLEHMAFALSFALWLAVAAGAALIHAVVPALFETTGSRIIKRLHAKIEARH